MSTQDNINEIAKIIRKAMTAQEAASRGLVPQSGNPDKPGRWIKDPKAEGESQKEGSKASQLPNSGRLIHEKQEMQRKMSPKLGTSNTPGILTFVQDSHNGGQGDPEMQTQKKEVNQQLASQVQSGKYKRSNAIKQFKNYINVTNNSLKNKYPLSKDDVTDAAEYLAIQFESDMVDGALESDGRTKSQRILDSLN